MPTCHLNSVSHLFLLLFLFIFFKKNSFFFSFFLFYLCQFCFQHTIALFYLNLLTAICTIWNPGGAVYVLHACSLFFFHGALRPPKLCGLLGTGEEWDRERELRPTSLFTQLLRDGGRVGSGTRTQAHLPVHTAPEGRGKSGIGNENSGPPPCSHSSWGTGEEWDRERELRPTSLFTQLLRDGGRVGSGTRTQAHLPVHTAPEGRGKSGIGNENSGPPPCSHSSWGTGEEWDRERELRPTSLFTQLLRDGGRVGSGTRTQAHLPVHTAPEGRGKSGIGNENSGPPPCSHSSWGTGEEWDRERELRPTSLFTQLLRDGGRVGSGTRTQAHLPVHTAPEGRGKSGIGNENSGPPPCSHSSWGTGEEWDRERELRPTSLFTQLLRDGGRVGWGTRTQAHLPVHTAPEGRGKSGIGNENSGPPPCSHSSWGTGEEWDRERELRPTSLFTQFLRDGGRVGWGTRTQAHLPVHTAPEGRGKSGIGNENSGPPPCSHSSWGTGEEWDRERELRPTSLFTQLLRDGGRVGSGTRTQAHPPHTAPEGRGKSGIGNENSGPPPCSHSSWGTGEEWDRERELRPTSLFTQLLRDGGRVGSGTRTQAHPPVHTAPEGRGKSGIGNENSGPPPCSHSSWGTGEEWDRERGSHSSWTGEEWDRERELRPTPLFTQLLRDGGRVGSGTRTLTQLLRDGGRVGSGTRTQAHLPVHTAPEGRGKSGIGNENSGPPPCSHSSWGTGEEWDRERELRPTPLFTQLRDGGRVGSRELLFTQLLSSVPVRWWWCRA